MQQKRFEQIFIAASSEVADQFYPKNEFVPFLRNPNTGEQDTGEQVQTERSKRRGEYLRDQGVLCSKLSALLLDEGIIEDRQV
jgi:hypothetical protein